MQETKFAKQRLRKKRDDMKPAELIRQLSLEEKAALLSGSTQWRTRSINKRGIPSLVFSDGPHGVRRQIGAEDHLGLNPSLPATCFPTASSLAQSFDTALVGKIGRALGEEASAQSVDVLLGPGLNMKRSPLCGRNFEYYAEDPYLSGKLAAAHVRGVQSAGVSACVKHFAVNSQELRRMAMDAVLDERSLRELYLRGFEIAIQEGNPDAVMTSYNEVNGSYASENKHLITEILRGEWQYDGLVVTDWGGCSSAVAETRCGTDLEMPTPGFDSAAQIVSAVRSGKLRESAVDAAVCHIVSLAEKHAAQKKRHAPAGSFDEKGHHRLARRAAEESMVLLKNEPPCAGGSSGILPLRDGTRTAVIGAFAARPRIQGGGSSVVQPTIQRSLLCAGKAAPLEIIGYAPGYLLETKQSAGQKKRIAAALQKEACALAKRADVVLYCMGLPAAREMEGFDRSDLKLPADQIKLLKKLAAVNPNIVVLLESGSVVETDWMINCRALLLIGLAGQGESEAALRILCGRVCPSGRLTETWPLALGDTPAALYFPSPERTAEYREGLYVGYRYYQTVEQPVRFPFGYGLSYTSFSYSGFAVTEKGVRVQLKNTGEMNGAETVQLYIGAPDGDCLYHPRRELKSFLRVFLRAGEEREIFLPFEKRSFQFFDPEKKAWREVYGIYRIELGRNAQEIVCAGTFELPKKDAGDQRKSGLKVTEEPRGQSSRAEVLQESRVEREEAARQCAFRRERERARLPHYFSGKIQAVPDAEFAALLGRPIPDGRFGAELGHNDAIMRLTDAKNPLARLIGFLLLWKARRSAAAGQPNLNLLFIANMPFRGIAKMTGGCISMEMVNAIVDFCNGHSLRGIKNFLRGSFRNKRRNRHYRKLLEEAG